jgi:hypothetical protein
MSHKEHGESVAMEKKEHTKGFLKAAAGKPHKFGKQHKGGKASHHKGGKYGA